MCLWWELTYYWSQVPKENFHHNPLCMLEGHRNLISHFEIFLNLRTRVAPELGFGGHLIHFVVFFLWEEVLPLGGYGPMDPSLYKKSIDYIVS